MMLIDFSTKYPNSDIPQLLESGGAPIALDYLNTLAIGESQYCLERSLAPPPLKPLSTTLVEGVTIRGPTKDDGGLVFAWYSKKSDSSGGWDLIKACDYNGMSSGLFISHALEQVYAANPEALVHVHPHCACHPSTYVVDFSALTL